MRQNDWIAAGLALSCAVAAGLTACQVGGVPAPPQDQRLTPLQGTVTWVERTALAQPSDVSNGATVSLIDTTTGQTVGTTVTQSNGGFALNFGSSFRPTAGKPYVLEAVKGLSVGLAANRAGASLARIRTILFYEGTTWKSLSSSSAVSISPATTTLAAIASLRGLSTSDQAALLSKLTGTTFADAGTVVTAAEFSHVHGLVSAALATDRDPLAVLAYDPAGASVATRYAMRPGDLVLHNGMTPSKVNPGGVFTVLGQNLPTTDATVTVGALPVATWSVNPARTELRVTLTAQGYSGWLSVAQGSSNWMGPFVRVAGTVGTYAGMGYPVVSSGKGTLAGIGGGTPEMHADGTLYVFDGARLRKVAPDGMVSTLAGGATTGYLDGSGTAALFNGNGFAIDPTGGFVVADRHNHRIRRVSTEGVVTTLAGAGSGYQDGTGTGALFNEPSDVAVDASGTIYACEVGNRRIRKITPAGVVTTLAGSGAAGSADGTGTAATFNTPYGLCVDSSGNVYVREWGGWGVRKITPEGVVTTLAGGSYGFADGTGTGAMFKNGKGIDVDASGHLYVIDPNNDRIRKVTPGGGVTTLAGSGTRGYLDGAATIAQLNYSHEIDVAPNGDVFVGDGSNYRLRIFVP